MFKMANILDKDPFAYEEERKHFLQDLYRFHQNRGTPYDRIPHIAGREVDLYHLYRRVIGLGGWQKVNNEDKWQDIQAEFKVPTHCINGVQALKYIYFRFLNMYEKVHFLGEDPDQPWIEEDDHPARKKACTPIYGYPLRYNSTQHQISETARQAHGLSTDLLQAGDYDKLEKALISGLPNEVDFVFNVCTLLSSEGHHCLNLEKSQHILPLFLAHIGIFEEEDFTCFEELYLNGWIKHSKRDFLRFWFECVKNEIARNLITFDGKQYSRDLLCGDEVLHLGRDVGIYDKEGQRVTQLAVLLRNLSFEEENQKVLATDPLVFKFLLLCVHSSYGSLKQLALDTLGNLATQMVLAPAEDSSTKLLLGLVTDGLYSDDKFVTVRALEILGKLCVIEQNEMILSETLEDKTYNRLCQLLTVYDIQLIVHTLETMYQLSELGDETTTRIAAVRNAVDLLISLLTVEAQSYGPNSLIGIKVVECVQAQPTVPSESVAENDNQPPATMVMQPPGMPISVKYKPSVRPPTVDHSLNPDLSSDIESTTLNWLQTIYEHKKGIKITLMDLLSDYLKFCRKFQIADVLPSADFIQLVKEAFPQSEMTEVMNANGDKEDCFVNISKRLVPKQFSVSHSVSKTPTVNLSSVCGSPQSSPDPPPIDLTQTPTLRQRLMEPSRIISPQPLFHTGVGSLQPLSPTSSEQIGSSGRLPLTSSTPQKITHPFKPSTKSSIAHSTVITNSVPVVINVGSKGNISNLPFLKPKTFLHHHLHTSPGYQKITPKVNDMSVENQHQQHQQFVLNINDSANPNLIKSLLAKKLNQNIVVRQAQAFPRPDNLAPVTRPLVIFTNQIAVPSQTTADVSQSQIASISFSQVAVNYELVQHNNNHTSGFPGHCVVSELSTIQPDPQQLAVDIPQTSMYAISLKNSDQLAKPTSPKSKKQKKTENCKKETCSPCPFSFRTEAISSYASSRLGTSSPRSASPQPFELEVCGEVECAKDIVKSGAQTIIERVENRCLDKLKDLQNKISKPFIVNTSVQNTNTLLVTSGNEQKPMANNGVMKSNLSEKSLKSNNYLGENVSNLSTSKKKFSNKITFEDESVEQIIRDKTFGNCELSYDHSKISEKCIIKPGENSEQLKKTPENKCGKKKNTSTGISEIKLKNSAKNISSRSLKMDCFLADANIHTGLVNGLNSPRDYSLSQCETKENGSLPNGQDIVFSKGDAGNSINKMFNKKMLSKLTEKSNKLNGITIHMDNVDSLDEQDMEVENKKDVNTTKYSEHNTEPAVNNSIEFITKIQNLNSNHTLKCSSTVTNSDLVSSAISKTFSLAEQKCPVIMQSLTSEQKMLLQKQSCKDQSEKMDISLEKVVDNKICDTRHVPTPESRDGELSSDSFASSTAESVSEKHSTPVTLTIQTFNIDSEKAYNNLSSAKTEKKKTKPRKRNRSNASSCSSESKSPAVVAPIGLEYVCEWDGCKKCFENSRSVFFHVSHHHVKEDTDGFCKWEGCEVLQRTRWSLVTHCQDHHCSESALLAATIRRHQASQHVTVAPPAPPASVLIYPADAAMQAIKRFSVRSPFAEFQDSRKGPVTKHIHLTAGLILRNLARYSALGRSLIKKRENHLSYQAMSAIESSTALANCLWEILHDH